MADITGPCGDQTGGKGARRNAHVGGKSGEETQREECGVRN